MDAQFLANTLLFKGTSPQEAKSMLKCLAAYEKNYKKGEIILQAGSLINSIGLVLSGGVDIEIDDAWGGNTILSYVKPGQLFAETYACIPGEPLLVNVRAVQNTTVLFLNAEKLMTTCSSCCSYHNKLIQNLLQISAHKNLSLSRRSIHTSAKSIRGRLLSYLSEQVKVNGSYEFTIPFDRQQLADYLGVERSALSNELSKMQKDGLISFHKNEFIILRQSRKKRI
jgi:CRP-like cAMP-binding protein